MSGGTQIRAARCRAAARNCRPTSPAIWVAALAGCPSGAVRGARGLGPQATATFSDAYITMGFPIDAARRADRGVAWSVFDYQRQGAERDRVPGRGEPNDVPLESSPHFGRTPAKVDLDGGSIEGGDGARNPANALLGGAEGLGGFDCQPAPAGGSQVRGPPSAATNAPVRTIAIMKRPPNCHAAVIDIQADPVEAGAQMCYRPRRRARHPPALGAATRVIWLRLLTLLAVATSPFLRGPHVVRTDFHDDDAWALIRSQILEETSEGFRAYVDIVEDPAFADLGADSVLAAIPMGYPHGFLVVVDHESITLPDHPVLVLDLQDPAYGRFRAVPSAVQQIENNLSIANMDFAEFAESVDPTGVFRGF